MGRVNLRYVNSYVDNRGVTRTYFRFKGKNTALPSPESAEFSEAYNRCLRLVGCVSVASTEPGRGTLAWLIDAYQRSPEFKRLAPRTRDDYTGLLTALVDQHGDRKRAWFTRGRIIQDIRDPLSDKPRRADYTIAVLSAVFGWAIGRELMSANPCKGIGKLYEKGEGYRAWTPAEIELFVAKCTEREFLVFVLALYTSLRAGDLAKLTWFQYDGERFTVRHTKNKAPLIVSAHPCLREVLDAMPRSDGTIITRRNGKPFDRPALSDFFKRAQKRIGLKGCTIHGLRTTNATLLAEGGASARQIMSVTGHRTMHMVEHYTRGAQQERMASASVAMLPSIRRG